MVEEIFNAKDMRFEFFEKKRGIDSVSGALKNVKKEFEDLNLVLLALSLI